MTTAASVRLEEVRAAIKEAQQYKRVAYQGRSKDTQDLDALLRLEARLLREVEAESGRPAIGGLTYCIGTYGGAR